MRRSVVITAILIPAILSLLLLATILVYASGVFDFEQSRGPLDRRLLWDAVTLRRTCRSSGIDDAEFSCNPLEISLFGRVLVVPASY